ncbi:MAG: hypothetical protein LBQ39_01070 [Tannerellaceae bacterium]|jgi:ABC-type Mn2+/Zn2+ transport system ATPase subunit|nr:hypothetical protein [Tannerellaceae bacterium]
MVALSGNNGALRIDRKVTALQAILQGMETLSGGEKTKVFLAGIQIPKKTKMQAVMAFR